MNEHSRAMSNEIKKGSLYLNINLKALFYEPIPFFVSHLKWNTSCTHCSNKEGKSTIYDAVFIVDHLQRHLEN